MRGAIEKESAPRGPRSGLPAARSSTTWTWRPRTTATGWSSRCCSATLPRRRLPPPGPAGSASARRLPTRRTPSPARWNWPRATYLLDRDKVPYLYLDGRTRDRAARVERFQNDPDPKLFLISLKAGGLGLNLAAAEYVFLIDPWWNPAVEAQAVDRAHRIGQTRPVFAYRLIAPDTVEDKFLALQQTKRDLAEAILNADNSPIRNLTREDLELLLS